MSFQEEWNMIKNILTNNKAFSLLEVTVVVIILTILASGAIPVLSRSYIEKVANKTALDISAIQEAARAYYIDNNKWPDSSVYPTPIAALQAGNYLPPAWNAINPFGVNASTPSTYNYNASSTGSTFIVSTFVPITAEPIIQNLLPTNWVTGNNVFSSVVVPGASSVMPTGSLLPWASNNLPSGFLWCNGQTVSITSYPGLYAVIGTTYGGNGINTFALPDIMGRTIVGVNVMGGANSANRITQWSSAPATVGGTFGEDAHRQTVAQMAPHTHSFASWDYVKGFSGNSTSSPRDPQGGTTGSAGGNGDGSGLGTPSNVVQPSIALGYIIKY
jgi:prepilin-type N-terminal cleavage/methylation domain-containing protein